MASPDGQREQHAAQDTIEPSAPTITFPHQHLEKQPSSNSSGADAGVDGKDASFPVEQYDIDPEKQSERVGSLQARSDSESERGPLATLWQRHWKKVAQLVTFMVFTASVTPHRRAHPVPPVCRTPS